MNGQAYEMTVVDPVGTAVAVSDGTLGDTLFARYRTFLDAKPRTVEAYVKSLKPFALFAAAHGVTNTRHITRELVLAYREDIKARCKPTTVQMYITALRLFVRWASQEGMMENVTDHLKGAKLDRDHKKDYLTAAQVRMMLDAVGKDTAQGVRDYALLLLTVTSGLRTIEIVRADIEDLRPVADFTALYVQGKGRDEKTEYIRLDPHAEAAIRAYLAIRGNADGKAPLFASMSNNGTGSRMTTRAVSGIIKGYLRAAGLNSSRLTAHSLRHTAATLSLLAGKPLEEVQQFLRHSQITTTMIYNHALDKAKNTCASAVGDSIFKGVA